jgi:prolipoprotein diacylglyceryltransferase
MKTLFLHQILVIHPETYGHDFGWIYLAAFAATIAVCLIYGARNRVPLSQIILTGTLFALFFIAGTKLFAFSAGEWTTLLSGGGWPAHTKITMLGGLAGLVAGILLALVLIRPHKGIIDALAAAMPLGMAIERVGCLLAGCCYGTPSSLPWAITYSSHSHAWLSQVANGSILPSALYSLPVHPVQAYDMLCCITIMILVLTVGKRLKATGSRLLLAIILYGTFRFFLEFVRDPGADFFPGTFWGINYAQWMIFAGLAVLIPVLLFRERTMSAVNEARPKRVPFIRSISLTVVLLLLFLTMRNLFSLPEKLVILTFLVPVLGMSCRDIFRRITVPALRLATMALLLSAGFLSSQTYIPSDPQKKVKFTEISIGGTVGNFFNDYKDVRVFMDSSYSGGGCYGGEGGYYTYPHYYYGKVYKYRHLSYLGGMDFRWKENLSKYNRLSLGAGVYLGQEIGTLADSSCKFTNFLWVLNPSFSYDWRFFGIKVGALVGKFIFVNKESNTDITESQEYYGQHTGEMKIFNFFPQIGLRVGPYDIAYLKVRLTDYFPQGNPVLPIMVGLGTGLGKTNGTRLEAGYSTSGVYADCYYPIKEKYIVQGGFAENFKSGNKQCWAVSLGFGYRFNYKTVDKIRK